MRLFIAFDISPETQSALRAAEKAMGPLPGVRWADPSNMHITVKFIGEFPEERAQEVFAVMREAVKGVAPFKFSVRELGWFPPGGRARIIWAGLDYPAGSMERIAARLEEGMRVLGVRGEDREFKPHITLGRVRGSVNSRDAEAAFGRVARRDFGSRVADELVLYWSQLCPTGAVYTRLGAVALTGQ